MEFSKFLDDDFDAKEWLNAAFRTPDAKGNKENLASTLALKLQVFIQEVHKSLEETGQKTVDQLPRVLRDVENAKREATFLKEQMQLVKEDIKQIEEDTSHSMETLVLIDRIKSRMQSASQALQDADNWSTLSEDIEKVFADGDLDIIAEKLVGMQHSLHSLIDIGDDEERTACLDELKIQYEGLVSTDIVASLNSRDREKTLKYANVFRELQCSHIIDKYYQSCLKTYLLLEWKKLNEGVTVNDGTNAEGVSLNKSDDDDEEPDIAETMELSLNLKITRFYDILLCHFHEQVSWCKGILVKPASTVLTVMSDTLSFLNDSIITQMAGLLDGNPDVLNLLAQLKQSSDTFAKQIESSVTKLDVNLLHEESCSNLAMSVYKPYRVYIQRYAQLESDLLGQEYRHFALSCPSDPWDSGRAISDSIPKLFKVAADAISRCMKITGGIACANLLTVLQKYFNVYYKDFRAILKRLASDHETHSSTSDWDHFLFSLRIIQYTGDLLHQTDILEKDLMTSLLSVANKLVSCSGHKMDVRNPFHQFDVLLLENDEDRGQLYDLLTDLERADGDCLLVNVRRLFSDLCQQAHDLSFLIVFSQISTLLHTVPTLATWAGDSMHSSAVSASSMPAYSYAPQEYMTKIGQYLMTLPQHLDTFTSESSSGVKLALNHGKLPHTEDQAGVGAGEHVATLWLLSIARATMYGYVEQVEQIPVQLSGGGIRQILSDMEYFSNVLEDLAVPVLNNMKEMRELLACDPEQFSSLARQKPPEIVKCVRRLRNLEIPE